MDQRYTGPSVAPGVPPSVAPSVPLSAAPGAPPAAKPAAAHWRWVAIAIVTVIMLASVVGVLWYGRAVSGGASDVLARRLCSDTYCHPEFRGWSWTHLLLYTAIGIAFPDHYLAALGVGVAWEGWEYFLSVTRCTPWDPFPGKCKPGQQPGDWWYARASDILFNMLGYTIGSVGGNAIRGRPLIGGR